MRRTVCWLTFGLTLLLAGCGSRAFTKTPRAALEQLSLSGAVDNALKKLDIPQVKDKNTYLDFANLECYDIGYVKAAVRSRFAEIGAHLVECAQQADYVAEIASGGFGTEHKEHYLKIPPIPVPGVPTLGEFALPVGVEQTGIIKLLVFVQSGGKAVGTHYHYYGKAERVEMFLLFFRFQPEDDIRTAWEEADQRVFLKDVQNHPESDIEQKCQRLGLPVQEGRKVETKLLEQGLTKKEQETTRLTNKGKALLGEHN